MYIHMLKDTTAPIYFFRKNLVLDNPFKKPPAVDQPEPSTSKHPLGRSTSSSASSTTSSSSSGKKSDKAGEKRKARSALDEIMEVRLRMFYTKIHSTVHMASSSCIPVFQPPGKQGRTKFSYSLWNAQVFLIGWTKQYFLFTNMSRNITQT